MQKILVIIIAAFAALVPPALAASEGEVSFDIVRFQVEGNSLLPEAVVLKATAPYVGRKRTYGDVQKALEALEAAYRKRGYGAVQVYVPEQELTTGIVRLQVTEAVIGKVEVTGGTYFDVDNVRASVPLLKEGQSPNLRQLSENIQLANENPAKQLELTLGTGEKDGTVDAKLSVTEENPQKFTLSLDNTGTKTTGRLRLGASYQHANMFNRDQVFTLAYIGSPDKPGDVKVDIYSIAYRLPFYGLGDSLDFMYASSTVNVPSTAPALSGGIAINGKGEVMALRWNHLFPRNGEYTSRLVLGLDYKHMNSTCDPEAIGVAGCTPYTLRPWSATYSGMWQRPSVMMDFNLGVAQNLPLGADYSYILADGKTGDDRYTAVGSSNRDTPDNFMVYRLGGSYLRLIGDWAVRAAVAAQYSSTALPSPEQLGIAGATAVRGFNERAVAGDRGYYANIEVYSPELAKHVGGLPGTLKAVAFYDMGRAYSLPGVSEGISSLGLGLRYGLDKDVALKLDAARIQNPGPETGDEKKNKGDWQLHGSLSVSF